MRIGYSDDESYPGQFELWQGNCRRSLKGRKGQAYLRELEAALLALPTKRLIAEDVARDGDVCAVGAWMLKTRTDAGEPTERVMAELEAIDSDDVQTDDLAIERGVPRLCAWATVEQNDIINRSEYRTCEGPMLYESIYWNQHGYRAGYQQRFTLSPEERYERVLAWVREQLKPTVASHEAS